GRVEPVYAADQPAAELRREPDALRFAAAQRSGRTVERQVLEPDVAQELEPPADLLQRLRRDLRLRGGERETAEEGERLLDGHARHVAHVLPADRDGERLGGEPAALAARADALLGEHEQLVDPPLALLGLAHPVLDLAEDAAEARVEGVLARLDRVGGLERGADALGHADAAQEPGALLRRQLLPRLREVGTERARRRLEDAAVPAALLREVAPGILGEQRPAEERQRRIDEDLVLDD